MFCSIQKLPSRHVGQKAEFVKAAENAKR